MKYSSAILGLCVAVLGCGDSAGPDAGLPADLIGEWVARPACAPPCAFTLSWTANPQATLDAVAQLGLTVSVQITKAGDFTLDAAGEPSSGRVKVVGSAMVVTDAAGATDTIDYHVESSQLHLSFRRIFTEIDFNGDGQADPSRASAVLVRR